MASLQEYPIFFNENRQIHSEEYKTIYKNKKKSSEKMETWEIVHFVFEGTLIENIIIRFLEHSLKNGYKMEDFLLFTEEFYDTESDDLFENKIWLKKRIFNEVDYIWIMKYVYFEERKMKSTEIVSEEIEECSKKFKELKHIPKDLYMKNCKKIAEFPTYRLKLKKNDCILTIDSSKLNKNTSEWSLYIQTKNKCKENSFTSKPITERVYSKIVYYFKINDVERFQKVEKDKEIEEKNGYKDPVSLNIFEYLFWKNPFLKFKFSLESNKKKKICLSLEELTKFENLNWKEKPLFKFVNCFEKDNNNLTKFVLPKDEKEKHIQIFLIGQHYLYSGLPGFGTFFPKDEERGYSFLLWNSIVDGDSNYFIAQAIKDDKIFIKIEYNQKIIEKKEDLLDFFMKRALNFGSSEAFEECYMGGKSFFESDDDENDEDN